jgi:hypothetical protein
MTNEELIKKLQEYPGRCSILAKDGKIYVCVHVGRFAHMSEDSEDAENLGRGVGSQWDEINLQ